MDWHARFRRPRGADIAIVCRDATMMAMRRLMEEARKKGVGLEAMRNELMENKVWLPNHTTQPIRQHRVETQYRQHNTGLRFMCSE